MMGSMRRRASSGDIAASFAARSDAASKEISGADGSVITQLWGVGTTLIYGFVMSFIILKVCEKMSPSEPASSLVSATIGPVGDSSG